MDNLWTMVSIVINVKLTRESSLQLGTAKLFAYAEVMKSEFNKISEIFPIFINLVSLDLPLRLKFSIPNWLFKIEGQISGIDSLLNFIEPIYLSITQNNVTLTALRSPSDSGPCLIFRQI